MNRKLWKGLGVAALLTIFSLIFSSNMEGLFSGDTRHYFLLPNRISGSALLYGSKEFTLNFEQQRALVSMVNEYGQREIDALAVDDVDPKSEEKVFFYFFYEPTVEMVVVGEVSGSKLWALLGGEYPYYVLEDQERRITQLLREVRSS